MSEEYKYDNYTKEEKEHILTRNEFEVMEGYCFDKITEQNYQNHFVSKEDIEQALKNGYEKYFLNSYYDYIMTLDEAWENFIEYYWDDVYQKYGDNEEKVFASLRQFLDDKKEGVRDE